MNPSPLHATYTTDITVQFGRFLSPDPMAGSYTPFSPYTFCAANPLRYSDPTGMDVWVLDSWGNILERVEDRERDKFLIAGDDHAPLVDEEGLEISIEFEYGTVESQRTISYGYNKFYDTYAVRGDGNARKLFEFLSDNISGSSSCVEFSIIMTGVEGEKGLNFINTGHARGSEPGMSKLYSGQLEYGYYIRRMIHSHPIGKVAGGKDISFKSQIKGKQQRNIPQFIYHVPTKSYIPF